MLEPIKFLFILTGASTYLVTKYIKVDDGKNGTTHATLGNASAYAGNDSYIYGHHHHPYHNSSSRPISPFLQLLQRHQARNLTQALSANQNRSRNKSVPLETNLYHIALVNDKKTSSSSSFSSPSSSSRNDLTEYSATFEIEIDESDDRHLPKRLLQISLSNEDGSSVLNGRVEFHLEPPDGGGVDGSIQNPFALNRSSGELTVLEALDRDPPTGRSFYKLFAYAQDIETRKRLATADIHVRVRDVNDNRPSFGVRQYFVNVSEDALRDAEIVHVHAEDVDEGSNGNVRYSLIVNQYGSRGEPVFNIDEETGVVRLAQCCLDRERRSNYTLKVQAFDGGGLKSTVPIVVQVLDVNDERPRFVRREISVEIDENDAHWSMNGGSGGEQLIAKLQVHDRDTAEKTQFAFRIADQRIGAASFRFPDSELSESTIVTNNKNYSDFFRLNSNSEGASLVLIRSLDFERPAQRFIALRIIVTDSGVHDFHDPEHLDQCFVYVKIRDINDNSPVFVESMVNITALESTSLGTILTKFQATDADQGGHAPVLYSIAAETNRRRHFTIDSEGFVRLARSLDRESVSQHRVKIYALDQSERIASATLLVNVEDVNDNPPELVESTLPIVVNENQPSVKIAELLAFDRDDYTKGNGPPFTFYISSDASEDIRRKFRLESEHKGEGRAILYTNVQLDREENPEYRVPILIRDSGYPAMQSVSWITVVVGDLNDNPPRDGWSEVTVWALRKTDGDQRASNSPTTNSELSQREHRSFRSNVIVGKVNVDDPDDWDGDDKVYFNAENSVMNNFVLDTTTGHVIAKNISEGDHELHFTVFDGKFQQQARSTMRLKIKDLQLNDLINSGSLTVRGISARKFISEYHRHTGRRVVSFRTKLEQTLQRILAIQELVIVAISDVSWNELEIYFSARSGRFTSSYLNVILSSKMELLRDQLPNLNITRVGIEKCRQDSCEEGVSCYTDTIFDWSVPYEMIHANFTTFVGPRVRSVAKCGDLYAEHIRLSQLYHMNCDLNPSACSSPSVDELLRPALHCSTEERLQSFTVSENKLSLTQLLLDCQMGVSSHETSRTFGGNSWAWLDSLPSVSNGSLGFEFITTKTDSVVLFHGPITTTNESYNFLLLELANGQLRCLFDLGFGLVELTVGNKLNDNRWHRAEIFFDSSHVTLVLDHCSQALHKRFNDLEVEFDLCRNTSQISGSTLHFSLPGPFQIGGLATDSTGESLLDDRLSAALARKYHKEPNFPGFVGCVRNIDFSGRRMGLGRMLHQAPGTVAGCEKELCSKCDKNSDNSRFQNNAKNNNCDPNNAATQQSQSTVALSSGALSGTSRMNCDGFNNNVRTPSGLQPIMFRGSSLIQLSLNANGNDQTAGYSTIVEIKFRIRQRSPALLLKIPGNQQRIYQKVMVVDGRIEFWFSLNPNRDESLIAALSADVADGQWHSLAVHRYGRIVSLTLDDGHGFGRSKSFIFEKQDLGLERKENVKADWNWESIWVGGEENNQKVVNDFAEGCISELVVNGRAIPFGMLLRGQRSTGVSLLRAQGVDVGCRPSVNSCASLHCSKPFQCVDEWLSAKCKCPNGFIEVSSSSNSSSVRNTCVKISELCKRNPCRCRRLQRIASDPISSSLLQSGSTGSNLSVENEIDCDLSNDGESVEDATIQEPTTTVNARIFQLEYGVFLIVILALVPLNIPFVIYIAYICCRRRRQAQLNSSSSVTSSSFSASIARAQQDLNAGFDSGKCGLPSALTAATPITGQPDMFEVCENIVCYRDEGGGEHDIRAYDLVPLRIAIAGATDLTGTATLDGHSDELNKHFMLNQLTSTHHPTTTGVVGAHHQQQQHSSNGQQILDLDGQTWQELTVV